MVVCLQLLLLHQLAMNGKVKDYKVKPSVKYYLYFSLFLHLSQYHCWLISCFSQPVNQSAFAKQTVKPTVITLDFGRLYVALCHSRSALN